ncbi:hypothetical protein QBC45DRAFT_173806 [Copromyces sp. CBS 386.78]|nr:hypothetical protein QBC45DRAFT_173806 [Copromyces sp. CBS 386.78]
MISLAFLPSSYLQIVLVLMPRRTFCMEQRGDNFDFVSAGGSRGWWNKTWKCVGDEREAIPGISLYNLGQKHNKAGSEAPVGPGIKVIEEK